MGDEDVEADQLVERTDTGLSITTTLKRGEGTRDQDKHVVKAKGHTYQEAIEKHKVGMNYLEGELLDRARELQPGTDQADVDEDADAEGEGS